ncbi:MAG: C1 family peptidase [Bacteroidales bacterium]|nr:C1 family peptidase [Bacteroidales bacterium]
MKKLLLLVLALIFTGIYQLEAQQDSGKIQIGDYTFTEVKIVPHTAVKDQHHSGTCWSFAGTSFLEAEVMRLGGPELNLSEMWSVRNAYEHRADSYVQLHGAFNFGPGGEPHQVMETLAERGMVPDVAYNGLTLGEDLPVHNEMDNVLEAFVKAIVENKNRKLSPVWMQAYNGILDAYLGEMPREFDFEGKTYTPVSFASEVLKINPGDYVEVTSYMNHEYFENFLLKIPDNWDYEMYYNLPMPSLINIIDFAISQGYTVAWAADVSDKFFNHKKGLALVPEKEWDEMSSGERDSVFVVPVKQKEITPEMRQEAYRNYSTTDDHSMHIIGMVKDQDGNTWYKVKNSWAADSNDFGGYFYVSQPYILLRTVALYVSKDVVPQGID